MFKRLLLVWSLLSILKITMAQLKTLEVKVNGHDSAASVIASLQAEVERLTRLEAHYKAQDAEMRALLEAHIPQPLEYSCSVPGVEMAGWTLAQNGERGADLSYPIVIAAPQDAGRWSISPRREKSHAVVHKIERGISRIGLFLADPMGHRPVDGIPAAILSLAARLGLTYELVANEVGPKFVPRLHQTFYLRKQPSEHPISLLVGEFAPDPSYSGLVHGSYISSGNPHPLVFRNGSLKFEYVDLNKAHMAPALGLFAPKDIPASCFYPNRIILHPGDIMLLPSDGFFGLGGNEKLDGGYMPYSPSSVHKRDAGLRNHAEELLNSVRGENARTIAQAYLENILTFRTVREDDITLYVVKARPLSESE